MSSCACVILPHLSAVGGDFCFLDFLRMEWRQNIFAELWAIDGVKVPSQTLGLSFVENEHIQALKK